MNLWLELNQQHKCLLTKCINHYSLHLALASSTLKVSITPAKVAYSGKREVLWESKVQDILKNSHQYCCHWSEVSLTDSSIHIRLRSQTVIASSRVNRQGRFTRHFDSWGKKWPEHLRWKRKKNHKIFNAHIQFLFQNYS